MGRGPNKTLHMLVLGFLDREPSHPYGMLAAMRSIRADQWTNLNASAVYYTFDRLDSDGMLRATETRREGRRPEHTVYQITDQGRDYLSQLLRERLVSLIPMHPPIYPALLYSDRLEASTLDDAMSERVEMLSGIIEMLEQTLAGYAGDFGEPLRQLLRHAIRLNHAEIAWCEEFRECVRSGALHEGGSLPG